MELIPNAAHGVALYTENFMKYLAAHIEERQYDGFRRAVVVVDGIFDDLDEAMAVAKDYRDKTRNTSFVENIEEGETK